MIKAIVVDDEALTNEYICRLLRNLDVEVTGYTNPYEAFDNINIHKPDVLFLDIEMPEMDGLELAEKAHAGGYEGEFIFVTAYSQYAIDAFRVNALDYLLKPIRDDELKCSIERLKKRINVNLYNKIDSENKKIRISLFGNMSIYVGENKKKIRWMTAKSAEVIAFMLLQKTDTETVKWKLMDEVWPDKNREKADINLRSTISRLNKTLRENALRLHYSIGGKKSAEKYYIEYSRVIKNELQIEPSYSMKQLYKRMLENN